jgi:hypothetical protein
VIRKSSWNAWGHRKHATITASFGERLRASRVWSPIQQQICGELSMTSMVDTKQRVGRDRTPAVVVLVGKVASCVGGAALLFAAASLAIMTLYMVVNGPQSAKVAELQTAQEIENENVAFCRKLGVDQDSAKFVICADGLADIRRRHAERQSDPGVL